MVRPKGQTIRFPDDELKKLEALSIKTDLSINKLVIKIVKDYFEKNKEIEGIFESQSVYLTSDGKMEEILNHILLLESRIKDLEKK